VLEPSKQIAAVLGEPVGQQLSMKLDKLLSCHPARLSRLPRLRQSRPLYRGPVPSAPSLDSRIISDFPKIVAEFREKRVSLLWRGRRDGFGAKDFHRLSDGHANTLTVILDTKGNVFGGFTAVEWESRGWYKANDS
jgi:hypothetical protein